MYRESQDRCNVGFIGCGQLMTNQHIQNAHRSHVCRIHTLCDIDAARLADAARRYPPLKTTADYRQMLADPDVRLVAIAMDPQKHAACRRSKGWWRSTSA